MKKLTKTIELKKGHFIYVVTLTSQFMVGNVSKFGSTNFSIALKHSGESVGYGKMSKKTAKRIIEHTEANYKFFI